MLDIDGQLDTSELNDLAERLEAATDGRAMDLVFLHGFCAALVVGPRPVLPSHWLPWVWDCEEGEAGPHFSDLDDANEVLGLVMRFHNSVADALGEEAIDDFEPLFPPGDQDGLMAWCAGFLNAFLFHGEEWDRLRRDEPTWFLPFHLPAKRLETEQDLTMEEMELFDRALPLSLRHIRDHWRDQELPPKGGSFVNPFGDPPFPQPRRTGPKIGRNDLCPCGSGKKYKKCCGVN